MANGDFLLSEEEIDVEMFDSDAELSKSTATAGGSRRSQITYAEDSDSDFQESGSKRTSAASKRGGRGRGRGRGSSTAATRKPANANANDEEGAPKARRGRPPKPKPEGEDAAATAKPKSTRGRKKASTLAVDEALSEVGGEEDFDKPKPKRATAAKGKARQTTFDEIEMPVKAPVFDPEELKAFAQRYPDPYWRELAQPVEPPMAQDSAAAAELLGRIDFIDENHPLELLPHSITDQMALTGMALSPDGTLLATFGSSGHVHVWDTETFECLTTLRDRGEANIDEFFVGQFTPNSEYLIVGGKLKDRKRWSEADEDNHIMPCPLKIFNVLTGDVVACLEGHSEEILCIKSVVYKGENYYVTTSQDGYIRRWHMDSDWIVLLDSKEVEDGVTCMAFTVSFVPNTGNRYFMAATDDHVTLMDMERCVIVQRFDPIYSSYCDCGKFIELVEEPVYQARQSAASASVDGSGVDEENHTAAAAAGSSNIHAADLPEPNGPYAYFVTRGVELLDAEDNTVSSRPNTCTLHRLVYPTELDGSFELQEIRRYYHDEYLSNSWLIRLASNGRYILAPTLNGQVFVFSIATGQVTAVLRDHDTIEVRDCKFHPTKNLLFTCSDDGSVKAYRSIARPNCSTAAAEADSQVHQQSELDSPQTAAESPFVGLKEGVESLAVQDTKDSVAGDPASVPAAGAIEIASKNT
ncbi:hypothetical protein GGI04_000593 [Coemansia thaxteri]|uniref:Uncharacterized protein n=1 Tax=Coemansia thaxteri TaxID=2663907 RepID=A0A9W8EL07_9FUNG|nr:hypothetical protein H4R26_000881 [Coemansia thaxteri]KAJ2009290.1 hypothetical protein GGI04_000593 [Coemansia thaxteri]KAJ2468943.1 hypothetical protein GGI02_003542 [Coemansia sp. RSA 2322]KAJ2487142.1 hypothetical protein EV174_000684 [Coemansia sp. RSA 2320]